MSKRSYLVTDDAVFAAVDEFARQALADGFNPADLSYALAAVAVRMGLSLAPTASIAFAVVMRAVSDAASECAAQNSQDDLHGVTTMCGTTVH
jgi:hypothetical protein